MAPATQNQTHAGGPIGRVFGLPGVGPARLRGSGPAASASDSRDAGETRPGFTLKRSPDTRISRSAHENAHFAKKCRALTIASRCFHSRLRGENNARQQNRLGRFTVCRINCFSGASSPRGRDGGSRRGLSAAPATFTLALRGSGCAAFPTFVACPRGFDLRHRLADSVQKMGGLEPGANRLHVRHNSGKHSDDSTTRRSTS